MSQKSWHFKCEKNNIDLPGFMGELLRGGIFTIIFFGVIGRARGGGASGPTDRFKGGR